MISYTIYSDIELNLGNGRKGYSLISTAKTVALALKSFNECHPKAVVMRIVDNLTSQVVYRKPTGTPSHNSWHC